MNGYTRIRRVKVFGARVYIHWSTLLVAGALLALSIRTPLLALITIGCYLGILFVHEAGHAFFAQRLGYRPFAIYLGFVHGRCDYEEPYSRKHEAIVAWGGVAAQLALAIPLIVLAQTTSVAGVPGLGPVFGFLGYINLVVALFNLTPVPPLDGARAWALVPILWSERTRKPKPRRKFGRR